MKNTPRIHANNNTNTPEKQTQNPSNPGQNTATIGHPFLNCLDSKLEEKASGLDRDERLSLATKFERWALQLRGSVSFIDDSLPHEMQDRFTARIFSAIMAAPAKERLKMVRGFLDAINLALNDDPKLRLELSTVGAENYELSEHIFAEWKGASRDRQQYIRGNLLMVLYCIWAQNSQAELDRRAGCVNGKN